MQLRFDPWGEKAEALRLQEVAEAIGIKLELVEVRNVKPTRNKNLELAVALINKEIAAQFAGPVPLMKEDACGNALPLRGALRNASSL